MIIVNTGAMIMANAADTTALTQHWVLPVTGLNCASCVNRLEQSLKEHQQIQRVQVNLALESVDLDISVDTQGQQLQQWVEQAGFGLESQTQTYDILNVSCAGCVGKIESALNQLPGVLSAQVNLATEQLRLQWLEEITSIQTIQAELQSLNYPLDLDPETSDSEEVKSTHGPSITPVLLGGLLSLPMVVAMIGDLSGLNWMLAPWLQFLLTTPVQFYLGARFYRGAFAALKHGSANMDVLVALGTSAAYFFSLYLWLGQGSGHLILKLRRS